MVLPPLVQRLAQTLLLGVAGHVGGTDAAAVQREAGQQLVDHDVVEGDRLHLAHFAAGAFVPDLQTLPPECGTLSRSHLPVLRGALSSLMSSPFLPVADVPRRRGSFIQFLIVAVLPSPPAPRSTPRCGATGSARSRIAHDPVFPQPAACPIDDLDNLADRWQECLGADDLPDRRVERGHDQVVNEG